MKNTTLNLNLWHTSLRPRFEGCNVGTWIGFKHVLYLAEEAIVQWFREQGFLPSRLLEDQALSLEITSLSLRLMNGTRVDDTVRVELQPSIKAEDQEIRFKVTLLRDESQGPVKLATGKAAALIVRAIEFPEPAEPAPAVLEPLIVAGISDASAERIRLAGPATPENIAEVLKQKHGNSFVWPWRIPYFYCHNTYRLQFSGYARIMEEVVDLFLQDRGISIGRLLYNKEYNWIPVVSAAKIALLEDARLEETLYTVFTVEDIMQNITYAARMDCYVCRDGELIQTATGSISHAYVAIADRRVGTSLATFDPVVLTALTGKQ